VPILSSLWNRTFYVALAVAVLPTCNSGIVNGTVYEQNGYPLTGVIVHLDSASEHYRCESEYDGSYSIRVSPGTYRLSASLKGWRMVGEPRTLTVQAGYFLIKKDIIMVPPQKELFYSDSPIRRIAPYCE
jgi:hypothetical protein